MRGPLALTLATARLLSTPLCNAPFPSVFEGVEPACGTLAWTQLGDTLLLCRMLDSAFGFDPLPMGRGMGMLAPEGPMLRTTSPFSAAAPPPPVSIPLTFPFARPSPSPVPAAVLVCCHTKLYTVRFADIFW